MTVIVLAAIAVGCGDSTTTSAPTTLPTASTTTVGSVAPTTTVPVTTAEPTSTTTPPTVAPATSSPATTEAPATTTAPTTGPVATVSWESSDFAPSNFVIGYSGNWDGEPSPPAPADPSQPPADGYYVALLAAPWEPGDTSLAMSIHRLEYCADLPDGCGVADEVSNETNLDPAWSLELDVPLDSTTTVVVQGFSCWDQQGAETKQTTGDGLLELFRSFAADYDAAILPRFLDGEDDYDIAASIAVEPVGGFVAEQEFCEEENFAGPLRYVHGEAPVLLLQTLRTWRGESDSSVPLSPTDLIGLQGVRYTNGVPTFYFYAGFYS